MTADRDAPIGIFDSGLGGLTVVDQLPQERVLYVGDTAHAPYGPRPPADIVEYAGRIVDTLVGSGAKVIVIACNTAAAAGVREWAEQRHDVPLLEVITPAVRRALAVSRYRRIGVIGTSATVTAGAYSRAFATDPGVIVTEQACPSFVDFVERGITSGRQITGLAHAYLDPLQRAEVDTVVLGCTHYPLLSGVLQLVTGDDVTLVSSAEETAKDVLRVLTERDLLLEPPVDASADGPDPQNPVGPRHEFRATGDRDEFRRLAPSLPRARGRFGRPDAVVSRP